MKPQVTIGIEFHDGSATEILAEAFAIDPRGALLIYAEEMDKAGPDLGSPCRAYVAGTWRSVRRAELTEPQATQAPTSPHPNQDARVADWERRHSGPGTQTLDAMNAAESAPDVMPEVGEHVLVHGRRWRVASIETLYTEPRSGTIKLTEPRQ